MWLKVQESQLGMFNFVNISLDIETHFSFFPLMILLYLHISFEAVIFSILIINLCRHAFATLSFVSEIFIFLYVGMDALDMEKWMAVSNR